MNSLHHPQVAGVLERLFEEAEVADAALITELLDATAPDADPLAAVLEQEAQDYRGLYHRAVDNFLCVSPEFGRLLYICARARKATRVVEFGTSFGVSTIHLACAVRDGGGGLVIGTELEATKAARAWAHRQFVAADGVERQGQRQVAVGGVADVVDIRVGDALDTLQGGVDGPIDLVHLDGAFSLYLPVLRLLEPRLAAGAVVVAENGTPGYLDYVRDPANGYLSLTLPFDPVRGNELSLFTGI
jgi:predicted O-methyltransferase YrrM